LWILVFIFSSAPVPLFLVLSSAAKNLPEIYPPCAERIWGDHRGEIDPDPRRFSGISQIRKR